MATKKVYGAGSIDVSNIANSSSLLSIMSDRRTDGQIFVEQFDNLDAWTVVGTPTNGTATVNSNILTISDTASGSVSLTSSTVLADRFLPYTVEITLFHGDASGIKLRCALMRINTVVVHVEFENLDTNGRVSSLIENDVGHPNPTNVTPSGYDKENKSTLLFHVDPKNKAVQVYLYYKDLSDDDQYAKLYSGTYDDHPDRIQFLTGGATTGDATIEDIRVYDTCGIIIGDSIAKGSPLYDPVPSFYVSRDPESQVSYWLEQSLGGTRRILNQGKGGDNSSNVLSRNQEWVLDFQPEFVIYWIGTNDIGGGVNFETLKGNILAIWDQAINAGIKVIHVETLPRNLFDSTQKARILEYNAWLVERAAERGVAFPRVYDLFNDVSNDGFYDTILTDDDVHPSILGYKLAAHAIWRSMASPAL